MDGGGYYPDRRIACWALFDVQLIFLLRDGCGWRSIVDHFLDAWRMCRYQVHATLVVIPNTSSGCHKVISSLYIYLHSPGGCHDGLKESINIPHGKSM